MPYSICLTVRSDSRPVRLKVVCRIRGENRTVFSKNYSHCQAELGPALKLTARCALLAIRENKSCALYYSCSSLVRDNHRKSPCTRVFITDLSSCLKCTVSLDHHYSVYNSYSNFLESYSYYIANC